VNGEAAHALDRVRPHPSGASVTKARAGEDRKGWAARGRDRGLT
jgi:hypothetical protein